MLQMENSSGLLCSSHPERVIYYFKISTF